MGSFRIALAQINPTVGDLDANVARIAATLDAARDAGADLVAFPELAVCGYPPEDLLLKPRFLADCRSPIATATARAPPSPSGTRRRESPPAGAWPRMSRSVGSLSESSSSSSSSSSSISRGRGEASSEAETARGGIGMAAGSSGPVSPLSSEEETDDDDEDDDEND